MTLGARKGRKAEREVAKLCEQWWRRLEPECEFKRTPTSGGWATSTVRAHFRASGDLMTTAKHWPFTVEVKRREGWAVDRLFDGKSSPVWGWWRQAVAQGLEEDGVPMLWLRKGQQRPGEPAFPWLVMIPFAFVLEREETIFVPDVTWGTGALLDEDVDVGEEPPVLYFADRLLEVDPEVVAVQI